MMSIAEFAGYLAGRGVRGTGDGFSGKAMWTEPLSSVSIPVSAVPAIQQLTLQQAKEALARTFSVSPDAIEITIKG